MVNIVINKTAFLDAPITVDSLHGMTFTNESGAHQFVISAMQGGNPLSLTGSVSARFMRANNTTILLTGSVTNGKAVITLHQDCYNVPGRFQLAIFNTASGATTCIYAAIGTVQRTVAGELIDSGEAIPDISDLLAQIDACEQATAAANAAATKAVRYDTAQTLTDAQKAQARANIDVASTDDVDELKREFEIQTNSSEITFTSGGYIKTGGVGVGNIVNLTPVENNNYQYAIVNVNAGEQLIINGAGGGNPRLWAFVDSNDRLLSDLAEADTKAHDLILTAPANATRAIINISLISTVASWFGYCAVLSLRNNIQNMQNSINSITTDVGSIKREIVNTIRPDVYWERGYISGTGNTSGSTRTDRIRTNDFIQIPTSEYSISVPTGITAHCCVYSSNSSSSYVSQYNASGNQTFQINTGYYIKVWISYDSAADIDISVGNDVVITYNIGTSEIISEINNSLDYIAVADYSTMAIFQNFGVLGDSFASGGTAGGYARSWPQIIARMMGAIATNYSASGRATNEWLVDTEYGLAKLMSDDPLQLYMINFGINDHTRIEAGTMTLGTIADINKTNPAQNADSFYGYYGKIVSNVISHAPNAKIVLMSVARFAERVMDSAIAEIASLFEVPYMYLPNDPFFTSAQFALSISNGHPCAYGYGGMATAINRLMTHLMYEYHEYFRDFGTI